MSQTYRRNQLEWAIWSFLSAGGPVGAPPKVFLNRLKRLLDLDRQLGKRDGNGFGLGFYEQEGPGLGAEVQYHPYSAFALTIGVELLDVGFVQKEVVELCRACRPKLERYFKIALRNPPVPAEHVSAEDRPGCPTYSSNGIECADCHIFMVMQRIEVAQALPKAKTRGNKSVLLEPGFFRGRGALSKEFENMPDHYRTAVVVEIAETAVQVAALLEQAPLVKRGRK